MWARSRFARSALLVWALIRLPLLLLVAFALRESIMSVFEHFLSIVRLTTFAIDVFSTPISRMLCALLVFVLLVGWIELVRWRLSGTKRYLATLLPALALVLVGLKVDFVSKPCARTLAFDYSPAAISTGSSSIDPAATSSPPDTASSAYAATTLPTSRARRSCPTCPRTERRVSPTTPWRTSFMRTTDACA